MKKISVFIKTMEQYETIKNYNISMIYTDNLEIVKKDNQVYYEPSRTQEEKDLPQKLLLSNLGFLEKEKENVIDMYANVANKKTIELILPYANKITLSIEYPKESISLLEEYKEHLEIFIYGRVEACLLKNHPLFKEGDELEDYKKRRHPIYKKDAFIIYSDIQDRIHDINYYMEKGFTNFRVNFIDESAEEVRIILSKIEFFC